MWYTFWNSSLWVIGYAESTDGLHWNKYVNNPVIIGTENWEGPGAGKGSVIYKDGIFHMWYDSNSPNSIIVYAYSSDGINWTKPSEYNPTLISGGEGGFNSFNIGAPSIVSIHNDLLMYFTGLVNENNKTVWRIGLAYEKFPLNTPTPFPSLTPTPLPTLLPSPTLVPSPTPSPVNTKKVVFIPGLGASWNLEDIAFCKSTPNASWTMNVFGNLAYIPLLQTLENNGYDVSVFNYDWRKDIRDNISKLSNHINAVADSGEKVSLVGHSMGGLIGRSYLNQTFGEGKISTFITVGTPHKGATTTYPFWAGAENNYLSKELKIASSLLIHACKVTYNISELNAIHTYYPSVQNMLPTFDYLRDKRNNTVKPVLSMNHKNNYFPDSFSFPYFSIRLGTLSGYGENTVLELETKNPTSREITRGEWLDGKTLNSKFTKNGDGTVLNLSSTLDDAENITILGNHTEIIQSRTGVSTILGMLGNTHSLRSSLNIPEKNSSSKTNELSYGTIIVGYPADIWTTKNGKKIRKDEQGILFFDKPSSKTEEITFIPKGKETIIHVGQFTTKGEIDWKTYTFKQKSQFKKKLKLSKDTIVSNPME
jgi:pimeloyl-ACP methyl ester carboxylesterase